MHPNVFLKTFWRMELKPQVFVAMSFHGAYEQRFTRIIEPAIKSILLGGKPLAAYRVDNSKTGDSILTDIMDGIAHSQLVLADVSTTEGGQDGFPYRNGNVMYEVGLALACRQPSEVLLVRDDNDKFLFDVSTIPHITINFNDATSAFVILQQKILERLREQSYVNDARVQLAIASLSSPDLDELSAMAMYNPGTVFSRTWNMLTLTTIPRLLDKQLIRLVGRFEVAAQENCPPIARLRWVRSICSDTPWASRGPVGEVRFEDIQGRQKRGIKGRTTEGRKTKGRRVESGRAKCGGERIFRVKSGRQSGTCSPFWPPSPHTAPGGLILDVESPPPEW